MTRAQCKTTSDRGVFPAAHIRGASAYCQANSIERRWLLSASFRTNPQPSHRSTWRSADFAGALLNNPKLDARVATAIGARWTDAKPNRPPINLFADRPRPPLHRMRKAMSSLPSTATRRTEEDSWIAIALIALLGAAIIACAALASIYLHVALVNNLLIGS
jgi:hypothetical protein